MYTFPPSHFAEIDGAIQAGRGAAASVVGQEFDVRRLDDHTDVSISSNTPVLSRFPAKIVRTTSKAKFENQIFELIAFQATCDNSKLQIGDVCTQTGSYKNDGTVLTVAQMRPLQPTIWMRTEITCIITRPMPSAGRASQQPISGAVATPGYGGITKAEEQVLTLTDGLYEFIDPSMPGITPATVQCGAAPTQRVRDGKEPKLPTTLWREHFQIFCPILPGVFIRELDRFSFPSTGDRYETALLYTTDQTGLVGWIIIAEKTAV